MKTRVLRRFNQATGSNKYAVQRFCDYDCLNDGVKLRFSDMSPVGMAWRDVREYASVGEATTVAKRLAKAPDAEAVIIICEFGEDDASQGSSS